jgi:hypothetical protein
MIPVLNNSKEKNKITFDKKQSFFPNETTHNMKHSDKIKCCKFCNKQLANRHSCWRHEQKCKLSNRKTLEEQIKNLSDEIKEIKENKVNAHNTTNNSHNINNSHNTTNIQYIINPPSNSSIKHISYKMQKDILDKGLNSLIYLIELVNFNKTVPENHSFCVTSINDTYASMIDEKTNKVIKTNKCDLFDTVLTANLETLEKLTNNPKFSSKERDEYKSKITYLKTSIHNNIKYMKRYRKDINLISYNNKEIIKDTWENLKPVEDNQSDSDDSGYYSGDKPKGFDDLIEKIPQNEKPYFLKSHANIPDFLKLRTNISDLDTSESDSDSENCDYHEIKIKGKSYILEGSDVYIKTESNEKGKHYGLYFAKTGKVKKNLI